jgi:hypothetical protein
MNFLRSVLESGVNILVSELFEQNIIWQHWVGSTESGRLLENDGKSLRKPKWKYFKKIVTRHI